MQIVDLLSCFSVTLTLYVWYTLRVSPLSCLSFSSAFAFAFIHRKPRSFAIFLFYLILASVVGLLIVIQSLCVKCNALQAADSFHPEAVSSSKRSNAHGKDEQHDSGTNASDWKGQQSWGSQQKVYFCGVVCIVNVIGIGFDGWCPRSMKIM